MAEYERAQLKLPMRWMHNLGQGQVNSMQLH